MGVAVASVKLKDPQNELLEIHTRDDIVDVLLQLWPNRIIPVCEFHVFFGRLDVDFIKSRLGVSRTFYGVEELADFIWSRSNYARNYDE